MIFKRFLIDKIQDKNKVFQRQISNELKVKVKVKVNQTMLIQSPTIKEGKSSIYFWKQK